MRPPPPLPRLPNWKMEVVATKPERSAAAAAASACQESEPTFKRILRRGATTRSQDSRAPSVGISILRGSVRGIQFL